MYATYAEYKNNFTSKQSLNNILCEEKEKEKEFTNKYANKEDYPV